MTGKGEFEEAWLAWDWTITEAVLVIDSWDRGEDATA